MPRSHRDPPHPAAHRPLQGHDRVLASIHKAVELGYDPGGCPRHGPCLHMPSHQRRCPLMPPPCCVLLLLGTRLCAPLGWLQGPCLPRPAPPSTLTPPCTARPHPAVKVNVVVMRGVNDDEVPAFVELTRDSPINVRAALLPLLGYGAAGHPCLPVCMRAGAAPLSGAASAVERRLLRSRHVAPESCVRSASRRRA